MRRGERGGWAALAPAVALAAAFAGSRAEAAGFLVRARTEAQAYELRSYRQTDPTSPVLLPRRRIAQYLGLDGFELLPGQDLTFESNLRVYADFGLQRGEAELLEGARTEDADLLHAFLSYRSGRFQARLGRQTFADAADLVAFDGAALRYALASGLGAELYGGLWVKGAGFLGSGLTQPDGIRESASSAAPQLDDVEPLVGARAFWTNAMGTGVTGAIGYRRAWVAGRTDLERAQVEVRYGRGAGWSGFAGAEVDLYRLGLSQLRAEGRYDAAGYAVAAEVRRTSPVLSADSVWYYFASAPRDEASVRVDLFHSAELRSYGRLTAQKLNTVLNADPSVGLELPALDPRSFPTEWSAGGSAGGRLERRRWHGALDVTGLFGGQGTSIWVDATAGIGERRRSRFTADARVSLAYLRDALNARLTGFFAGGQVWATYAVAPQARASIVGEANANPLTVFEAKVFALIDLEVRL
ncbi:MAG TPA: hypothetical protein VFB81_07565 [Myxococcales bacterium]|nr:hypothetical protein [Myxococcales bacterium]